MRKRSFLRKVVFAAPLLALNGCGSYIPLTRSQTFREADYQPFAREGRSTVQGRIAVRGEMDGQLHVGAQSHLTLLPVTPYTKEMIWRELGQGRMLTGSHPAFHKYVRRATADAEGRFVFRGTPPGKYFLCGLVQWYSVDSYYQWACEEITVPRTGTMEVQVSHNVHEPGRDYVAFPEME